MAIKNTVYSVANNKCPRCNKGEVFEKKNPYNLRKAFAMYNSCSHCQLLYNKEPGFFYGAMYVSYGLSVAWFVMWFALQYLFLNWETLFFAMFVAITILVLSPLNLRLSRLIWLNLFNKFDRDFSIPLSQKHPH
jgi:uncharacterized protein (DUF983 family)